jgi:hypothetical protein
VLEAPLLRGAILTLQGSFGQAIACLRAGLADRRGARLRCPGGEIIGTRVMLTVAKIRN